MNESIRPSTYSIAWIPSVLLRQIEKNHQDERRIESIERAGNRDRALLRWTRDYPEAKNRWIGVEPYGILLYTRSVVWRGTSRRSVHSDNVWIRFDAGSLNAGWKVKTQAGLRTDGIDDDWGQNIFCGGDAPDGEFQRGYASHHPVQCYGKGFTKSNLYQFVQFYKFFPDIFHAVSGKSQILSWTHYRNLLRVTDKNVRDWYLNESINEVWSARTLDRNIASQYYYRLLQSQNKQVVKAEMGQITAPYQHTSKSL